jgi:hypothetical protein
MVDDDFEDGLVPEGLGEAARLSQQVQQQLQILVPPEHSYSSSIFLNIVFNFSNSFRSEPNLFRTFC